MFLLTINIKHIIFSKFFSFIQNTETTFTCGLLKKFINDVTLLMMSFTASFLSQKTNFMVAYTLHTAHPFFNKGPPLVWVLWVLQHSQFKSVVASTHGFWKLLHISIIFIRILYRFVVLKIP